MRIPSSARQLSLKCNNVSAVYLGHGLARGSRKLFSSTFEKKQVNKEDMDKVHYELLNDVHRLEELSVRGRLVKSGHEKKVGYWLLIVAGAVFGMIVLGGYTRLSKSGLSMTRWKPI